MESTIQILQAGFAIYAILILLGAVWYIFSRDRSNVKICEEERSSDEPVKIPDEIERQ